MVQSRVEVLTAGQAFGQVSQWAAWRGNQAAIGLLDHMAGLGDLAAAIKANDVDKQVHGIGMALITTVAHAKSFGIEADDAFQAVAFDFTWTGTLEANLAQAAQYAVQAKQSVADSYQAIVVTTGRIESRTRNRRATDMSYRQLFGYQVLYVAALAGVLGLDPAQCLDVTWERLLRKALADRVRR